jgi:hypothetical protein
VKAKREEPEGSRNLHLISQGGPDFFPRPGTTSSASEDSDNHLTVGWEEDHLNYKKAFTYSTFGRAQSKSSQVMGFVVGQLHCI